MKSRLDLEEGAMWAREDLIYYIKIALLDEIPSLANNHMEFNSYSHRKLISIMGVIITCKLLLSYMRSYSEHKTKEVEGIKIYHIKLGNQV